MSARDWDCTGGVGYAGDTRKYLLTNASAAVPAAPSTMLAAASAAWVEEAATASVPALAVAAAASVPAAMALAADAVAAPVAAASALQRNRRV